MSRTYRLYLNDILKAIARINQYTAGIDLASFKADTMRIDSALFNLMTIGEAVKNLPDEIRTQIPEVRWRNIARFRDRVVHHYFTLDPEIVWEIIQVHLPVLHEHALKLLRDLPDDSADEN